MNKNLLVIFAREPVPGEVKTRLAKDVGAEAAAALYDLMLRNVVSSVISRQYDILIYKTPESGSVCFEEILPGVIVRDQPEGDVGEKMSGVFRTEFGRGYGKICLIGTDCPGISSSDILRTFDLLGKSELVLGPSRDGGYYLIGLSAFHPGLFEGISWSTETVFSETAEKAGVLGIGHALISAVADIDDITGIREYIIKNQGSDLADGFERVLKEKAIHIRGVGA